MLHSKVYFGMDYTTACNRPWLLTYSYDRVSVFGATLEPLSNSCHGTDLVRTLMWLISVKYELNRRHDSYLTPVLKWRRVWNITKTMQQSTVYYYTKARIIIKWSSKIKKRSSQFVVWRRVAVATTLVVFLFIFSELNDTMKYLSVLSIFFRSRTLSVMSVRVRHFIRKD